MPLRSPSPPAISRATQSLARRICILLFLLVKPAGTTFNGPNAGPTQRADALSMATPEATEEIRPAMALLSFIGREYPLLLIAATAVLFLVFGEHWLADFTDLAWAGFLFAWLFCFIIWGAVRVVHHADHLAELLGEPYGTLILTLSVASIEVVTVAIVMLTGANNPTLGRDTMFAVVMIVMNGLIGLGLLLGGWRYREQEYNLRGANAYLSVILALAVFGLLMPDFTRSTAGPTFSVGQQAFLIVMCLGLYAVFLLIQTRRHRAYFLPPAAAIDAVEAPAAEAPAGEAHGAPPGRGAILHHAAMLVLYLAATISLADHLGESLNHGLDDLGAPPALGAFVVAVLVLSPEALGAIKAALANQLQRTVNILLGSVLATLALTIPALLLISLRHGVSLVLGLDGPQGLMLALTLLVSTLTLASGRSNVLQGAVHLMLFLAYLMLVVWG
jgi:Ca2+:H+ antiporter